MSVFLIVCPFVFLAGFVDAIAGGGGLISLPVYMIAGLPAHVAIATNKLSSSMGTTVASIEYFRKGFMKADRCIPSILMALAGAWCGAHLSLSLSEALLEKILLVLLPLIAIYVFFTKKLEPDESEHLSLRSTIIRCGIISFLVGIYDGLYGPGTGTFLMLLFTGVCKMSLNDSAGTTKAINLTTNLTSLAVFLMGGKVWITLGIAAGCCNMLGNYLGSRCFTKKGASLVRPIILLVLVIFIIKLL